MQLNFVGTHVIARLNQPIVSGGKFSCARMEADLKNQPIGQMRNVFSSADPSSSNFSDADINRALFAFASGAGTNFRDAMLFRAVLSNADLSGADLTGADFTEANLDCTTSKKC